MKALTQRDADALKPPTGFTKTGKPVNQAFLWCPKTNGFGIRVTRAGAKAWIAQGRVNTKERRITLGSHERLSCEEARKRAKAELLKLDDGIDPVLAKLKEKATETTLSQVAEDYIEHRKTKNGPLRPHTIADIRKHCTKALGAWEHRSIASITPEEVLAKFRELSKRGKAQANQAMRIFQSLHKWARKKNATMPANPVAVLSGEWHPPKARTNRVPFDKVGEAWKLLAQRRTVEDRRGTRTAADAVALQFLTGMRWGELSSMQWTQLDLDGKVPSWHIPSEVAKNWNEITVPLSTQAVELLKARKALNTRSAYVFPCRGNNKRHIGDPRALWAALSKVSGLHLSSHAMRRTFTNIAIKSGGELWRAELLTNHRPQSVTLIHYLETSDLREEFAADVQRIADWIEACAKAV